MTARLDYRWHLRKVMADRGMFATTDLIEPLAQQPIESEQSQVEDQRVEVRHPRRGMANGTPHEIERCREERPDQREDIRRDVAVLQHCGELSIAPATIAEQA